MEVLEDRRAARPRRPRGRRGRGAGRGRRRAAGSGVRSPRTPGAALPGSCTGILQGPSFATTASRSGLNLRRPPAHPPVRPSAPPPPTILTTLYKPRPFAGAGAPPAAGAPAPALLPSHGAALPAGRRPGCCGAASARRTALKLWLWNYRGGAARRGWTLVSRGGRDFGTLLFHPDAGARPLGRAWLLPRRGGARGARARGSAPAPGPPGAHAACGSPGRRFSAAARLPREVPRRRRGVGRDGRGVCSSPERGLRRARGRVGLKGGNHGMAHPRGRGRGSA